jgi:DNA-binding transcriptional MerR regulator
VGEWSIQELARAAGTTSRTLRHYGEVGVLAPSRVGPNGYRFYDDRSLVRLQRILLLRELGLAIPEIARILAGEADEAAALGVHLELLELERERLARQIASVKTTIRKVRGGRQFMPEEMFEGFDHTQYRKEVIERWGEDAYARGDRWWRSQSDDDKQRFQRTQVEIAADYGVAQEAGKPVESDDVQAITRRHVDWLSQVATPSKSYLLGLGELYVNDPRFAANYDKHGAGTAAYVRDALTVYAERNA